MNDFEKIEHLLLSKKFEELNPSELKEVQGYFENATEYSDMRETLMQVKSTLAADKLLIKPSVDLKEKLLQQFENTHGNKTAGKTRPFYRKMAFQWSAAASIVILLTLSTVAYFNNMNGAAKSKEMAVNYEKKSDDGTPSSEKSNMNSDLTIAPADSTATTTGITTGENRNGFVQDAQVGSTTMDAEEDKNVTFGNISTTEETVKESDVNHQSIIINPDLDNKDESNKPVMKDNTTLDTKTRTENEGARDDANDQYNNKLKGKEESKVLENSINNANTVKTVNEKNTNTDTKDYWQRKKQNPNKTKDNKGEGNKEATEDIQLGGYMSVNQMVQTDKRDSLKANVDSLQIDSNQLRNRQRDAKLDSQKDEKNN
jgi:hypothetical protein